MSELTKSQALGLRLVTLFGAAVVLSAAVTVAKGSRMVSRAEALNAEAHALNADTHAAADKDAREMAAAAAVQTAYDFRAASCVAADADLTWPKCRLAAWVIKLRRDNPLGGAAMYDQDPGFLEWQRLTHE